MDLPTDIKNIISDYTEEYKFVEYNGITDIIELRKNKIYIIDLDFLSLNPDALFILEENQEFIDWEFLCENNNAFHLINQNLDKLTPECWESTLLNNSSIHSIRLIKQNLDILDKNSWSCLSQNKSAFNMMVKKHFSKIDWKSLSINVNPKAINLLEKNLDKINWMELSINHKALRILEKHQDKICWSHLSLNHGAINLLKNNLDKIDWRMLSMNKCPGAIELLKQNPYRINWEKLISNPFAIELIESKFNDDINFNDNSLSKEAWENLSKNSHPNAIKLLNRHFEKINWKNLSDNPNAIPLLAMNICEINKVGFIKNPNVLPIIYANLDKLLWTSSYKENEKFYKLELRRAEF
jgi:hypothetical protein